MERHRKESATLTASEALEENRKIAAYLNWDRRMVGVFCQAGLVVGKYDRTLKEWVVSKDSFDSLVRYMQGTLRKAAE